MIPSPRDATFWRYITQVFVGLFFCSAAYYKLTDSFFGMSDVPLASVFDFWIQQGFPIGFYRTFMQLAMPYAGYISGLVIALQGAFGIMMLYGVRERIAACLLFFVQINIFFATFHHLGFNVFVGASLWLAFYYFLRPTIDTRRWVWGLLILAVVFLQCVQLSIRYRVGDPWFAAYGWQHQHFEQNVMSISPLIKHLYLWIMQGTVGMYLWASAWWIQLILVAGLLTRWRLQMGSLLALFFYARAIVWTNTVGSDAVLWTLLFFVLIAQEEYIQRTQGESYLFIADMQHWNAERRKKNAEKIALKEKEKPVIVVKPKPKTAKEQKQEEIDTAPEPIS